jgi:predicted nucleotidyltransferase
MSLYALFSSKARVQVLDLLLTHPSERFYQREISLRTDLPIQAVQRELARLTGVGLVTRTDEGNRAYYQVNRNYYIYKELKSIFHKSLGIGAVLKEALKAEKIIDFAFIFGSVARGSEKPESDIDLLVLGDISARALNDLIFPVAEKTGREINQHLYSMEEYRERIKSRNHFVLQINKGPKLFLVGTPDEFKELTKIRKIKKA